tara:strand:- start:593 stop:895 length:303 start_codon:yes stop_codon:yes gene_type:complete
MSDNILKLTEFDKENFEGILVHKEGDWLSARLIRIISTMDKINREQMNRGFPDHVYCYEQYIQGFRYIEGEWKKRKKETDPYAIPPFITLYKQVGGGEDA